MQDSGQGHGDRWRRYYQRTADRPPRDTLLAGLVAWEAAGLLPGQALDLGCGGGRDTVELLRRGWHVLALDSESSAIEALRRRPEARGERRLTCRVARMEAFDPLPDAQLVNASFCLFLLPPDDFERTWMAIRRSLPPGGLFCGQLLGHGDDWAGKPGLTVLDEATVDRLLEGYRALLRREERSDSVTPRGEHKHWHLHHLVLQRLAGTA